MGKGDEWAILEERILTINNMSKDGQAYLKLVKCKLK